MIRAIIILSAAVAIAGCSDKAFEANPIQYSTVAGYADMDFGYASVLARKSLADGFLSNLEYRQVIAAADATREAQYRITKDRALSKWSGAK